MKKLLLIAFLLLCSCTPKIIEKVRVEHVYHNTVQKDTTVIRDSTVIREYVKGDTVRIIEYRDRYHYDYRYLTQHDTLVVVDSVAVERLKEVKVEKPLSFSQRVKISAFWWLLLLALGLGVWKLRKPLWKMIKKLVMRV